MPDAMEAASRRVARRYMSLLVQAGNQYAGKTVDLYPQPNAMKKQPPGIIADPALAKFMGWRSLGKVRIPSSSGVKKVPLSDLEGVATHPLDKKNLSSIEEAYREGATLPPIIIEVVKDRVQLLDGHHRLTVARKLGLVRFILVDWILRG